MSEDKPPLTVQDVLDYVWTLLAGIGAFAVVCALLGYAWAQQ